MSSPKVRYSYLPQQFSNPEEIFASLRQHLVKCEFTLGPEVEKFENSFANLIGTSHAVGVGSGTDAIKLALKALGVGWGDEVITAANTFVATVGAINEIGAKTVFVDCKDDFTIDEDQIERAITSKTKAIVPVHLTGQPANMPKIMQIAAQYNLFVVEDACQAILATIQGKNCGTFGHAAAYSLHPLKNLNVWGDAGVVVTSDSNLAERLKMLRNHGMKNRDEIEMLGFNSRLDSVQAIVGNWLIPQTEFITSRRIENARFLDEGLSTLAEHICVPFRPRDQRHVFHLYMFTVKNSADRGPLLSYFHENGVEAKVHYPIPLYLQKGLAHLKFKRGDFPNTDRHADTVLSLPVDQHLNSDQLKLCVDATSKYFQQRSK